MLRENNHVETHTSTYARSCARKYIYTRTEQPGTLKKKTITGVRYRREGIAGEGGENGNGSRFQNVKPSRGCGGLRLVNDTISPQDNNNKRHYRTRIRNETDQQISTRMVSMLLSRFQLVRTASLTGSIEPLACNTKGKLTREMN